MAKDTEMAQANQEAAKGISEMEDGQEAETIASPTQDQNSPVMGDEPAAAAVPAVAKPKGDLDRRWRRKNDITTSHGLAREHARLIAAMHSGRVSLDAGDILSRAYGRQRELIATNELKEGLASLRQQLADLKNERSVVSSQFPKERK